MPLRVSHVSADYHGEPHDVIHRVRILMHVAMRLHIPEDEDFLSVRPVQNLICGAYVDFLQETLDVSWPNSRFLCIALVSLYFVRKKSRCDDILYVPQQKTCIQQAECRR